MSNSFIDHYYVRVGKDRALVHTQHYRDTVPSSSLKKTFTLSQLSDLPAYSRVCGRPEIVLTAVSHTLFDRARPVLTTGLSVTFNKRAKEKKSGP
jgi:hypothetical protein